MTAKTGEFKGHKTMILSEEGTEDKYPFSFGLKKAKLILQHIDEIKKFVEENQ
ncbi:hypothetical protein J4476_00355 [Candidatus Woesearchaeota archaeon]|nr:hypothetical protein [Candidatus Woesearchaeota archaeon]HIH26374.1 hypothetical protein [Nanoarchaeota archaeon]